jgi:hypothetical protein
MAVPVPEIMDATSYTECGKPLFHMALSVQKRGLACRTLYLERALQQKQNISIFYAE